ncbi:MAG: signal recognition particle-docking protein FtsY [Pyrinomonadaceae bacterium MAG19_C2-C3]|nr:signal recognition particle-docking protein FtsY [Pyrinomonadaceae bacterium MAG19_C2-C3]
MALFWKRKSKEIITLGLNDRSDSGTTEASSNTTTSNAATQTAPVVPVRETIVSPPPPETPAQIEAEASTLTTSTAPSDEPTSYAASNVPRAPTQKAREMYAAKPTPTVSDERDVMPPVSRDAAREEVAARPRSSFSSSILGLDKSIAELAAEQAALEATYAARFRRAVEKTRHSLNDRIDTVFQARKQIDAELLDELEEVLIAADLGVPTTMEILDAVRRGVTRKEINDVDALKRAIKNHIINIFDVAEKNGVANEVSVPESVTPYVMMIVGVNGVGKTTTIGKLAQRIKAEGNEVLICAADTFRAAASDQLAIWAERTGVPLIQQKTGTDPAAVLFDALKASKARNSDVLIVDTAGRLHTKSNLMAELEKMKRIAGREVEGAPHETLLVLDAVTGQNGLEQARQFLKTANITGIVLTKLDGTAKGGIAVAIAKELNLPIRYVGIGEKVDDLIVFDAAQYVEGLFG